MTTRYGLIGHPLGHSMSPYLHRRLFTLQGRTEDYTLYEIPPGELGVALPPLLAQAEGLNVTIPYKQTVIPFLHRLEGRAALYRSVNTIAVRREEGETICVGYNTDADGFRLSLEAAGIPLKGRVLLIGCGGVGRTIACEAALAGCPVSIAARPSSREKAAALCRDVQALAPGAVCESLDIAGDVLDTDSLSGEYDLLINATPAGMTPHTGECPVTPAVLSRTAAVFDAIYNPARTLLLRRAEAAGARTLGGMPMLVWQAAQAQTHWYGAHFRPQDIAALCADTEEEMNRLFSPGVRS
ncbi:MAG: shikimate dehydrogenase [Clostridiales bacterium]|nr:shikimate dehydrogenase [Clostridiales bacterium]